jgi:hypothetical protein
MLDVNMNKPTMFMSLVGYFMMQQRFSKFVSSTQLEKSCPRSVWRIYSSMGSVLFREVDSLAVSQVNTEMHDSGKAFMNVETKD